MADTVAPWQSHFADALLNADRPVPDAVTSHSARMPQKRFAVYRNNVVAGLISALRAQFPASERIVGDEFFADMARVYIDTEPPRSPILTNYGDGFADFVANFAPAADIAYLADVVRLEAARTRAYHAADAVPLAPSRWQEVDPLTLSDIRVALHPSINILRSVHPIVTIWAMNCGEAELSSIETWTGEDAVIARPGHDVIVRRLPPGGAAFLAALSTNATLGDAVQAGAADHPAFDLAANLAGLIGADLATEISVTPIHIHQEHDR
ncbi:MAG: DUF2063 domain-containing protein [Rhodopseudomonas sp.]|nr:DUF2063 domain-containing protein [Rhodopseudomonas sp.]